MKLNLDIPGWMRPDELKIIATIANMIPNNGHFIEIGAWCGRSTWNILNNLSIDSTLHVVDNWEYLYTQTQHSSNIYYDGSDENKQICNTIAAANNFNTRPCFDYFIPQPQSGLTINPVSSIDYNPTFVPNAVFLDGSEKFNIVDCDIKKYMKYDNCLIFGHSFNYKRLGDPTRGLMEAIIKNCRSRTLLVPQNTSLWMLIPNNNQWLSTIAAILG
jgi:hypothetical protein